MDKNELYEKYKKEEWARKISRESFYLYLRTKWGYDWVVEFLKTAKKTTNNKQWTFKRENTNEIVDYAKLFSPEKAAKEYDISLRTVYRYINLTK